MLCGLIGLWFCGLQEITEQNKQRNVTSGQSARPLGPFSLFLCYTISSLLNLPKWTTLEVLSPKLSCATPIRCTFKVNPVCTPNSLRPRPVVERLWAFVPVSPLTLDKGSLCSGKFCPASNQSPVSLVVATWGCFQGECLNVSTNDIQRDPPRINCLPACQSTVHTLWLSPFSARVSSSAHKEVHPRSCGWRGLCACLCHVLRTWHGLQFVQLKWIEERNCCHSPS